MVSEGYDWRIDPNGYRKDGHIPKNRCYHCGRRFLNSKYAAFCNVCDNEMSPPHEEPMFVITHYVPDAKPPVKEGYWTTRNEMVKNRIRIPDDMTEEEYKEKLKALGKSTPLDSKPEFRSAMDLAKGNQPDWKFSA